MTKISILILILFTGLCSVAQDFQWAKSLGGNSVEIGNSITTDGNGSVYVTGQFIGTVDFNPGIGVFNLSSAGNNDIFVCKFDLNGNFIWAKSLGGTNNTHIGHSIAVDGLGNVYTTGYFDGTGDFDPGTGTFNLTVNGNQTIGNSDIFISKLDSNGNFVYAKKLGGSLADIAYSMTIDISGNILITGLFRGSADFDPGSGVFNLVSAGLNDIFISKLDANGNFVWAKRMGGINDDIANSIASDAFCNVHTTGTFNGTADFNPGSGIYNLISSGNSDVFISKLDSNGNYVWAKRIGGSEQDHSQGIDVDLNGNVITTGGFQLTTDFDPNAGVYNLTSIGINYNIFISKLDANGNFVWAKSMPGNSGDEGNSVFIDTIGSVYTTGYFTGTTDFDPGSGVFTLSTGGYYDIFVSKLDSNGNFIWAKKMGGNDDDEGKSIVVDLSGNIYTTGYFRGTGDFDPSSGIFNLTSNGVLDVFISKWNQCSTIGISVSPSMLVCEGSQVTLIGTGGSNYIWSDGVVNGIPFAASSTNTYTVTATNSCGTSLSNTVVLSVKTRPSVSPIPNQSYCYGQTTPAIPLSGLPNGVIFDVTGGVARGLADQIGITSIPAFNASAIGSSVITITPKADGCIGNSSTYTLTVNNCPPITLNLKLFLQGYYIGNELMQNVLYNEGETLDPNSFNTDYVIVELHSAIPPYTVAKTAIGILKTNGTLTCSYPGSVTNTSYYIVVHHRNSITTWSANPVQMVPNVSYNFSNTPSKAFGDNQFDVSENGTTWAFYTGDLNNDDNIDLTDLPILETDINNYLYGYYSSDINGDGNVDLLDIPIVEMNVNEFIFSEQP